MRDRLILLEDACQALVAGDPEASLLALDRFGSEVARTPLTEDENGQAARQLTRLRGLAEASAGGIDAAREWLNELNRTLGGLDIYDRAGRQRLATELSGRPRRF